MHPNPRIGKQGAKCQFKIREAIGRIGLIDPVVVHAARCWDVVFSFGGQISLYFGLLLPVAELHFKVFQVVWIELDVSLYAVPLLSSSCYDFNVPEVRPVPLAKFTHGPVYCVPGGRRFLSGEWFTKTTKTHPLEVGKGSRGTGKSGKNARLCPGGKNTRTPQCP